MNPLVSAPHRAARLVAIAALSAALACAPAVGLEPHLTPGPTSIDVQASVIKSFKVDEPELQRFGHLDFRGGLELTSSYRTFGGL